ncbi:MAG: FAD-dependent oxidoreductase, partial [Mangrovicoccus sp.]|nr:FAD-dependent oxidoreductase [Mangrovicoccus sp.]
MTALIPSERLAPVSDTTLPVLVIGGGPVGMRAAQRLAAAGQPVRVINAESVLPYNRVKLTPLLAGEVGFDAITLHRPEESAHSDLITIHNGLRAERIDRGARQVITSDGGSWPYETLILATGSSAHMPRIAGSDLPGVFTFRDHADTEWLIARSLSARHVVVIGGGLLGLEAARGMQRRGAQVTIVEHEGRLMPRQLDRAGAAELQARIEMLGVQVLCGQSVTGISGLGRVEKVHLRDGTEMAADTVIICTGVRANTWLAKEAGLGVGRGVVVDDQLRSNDPAIFAVGECAEHDGQVYGLVGPGLDQADMAASVIAGGQGGYHGSLPATRLKVLGADVFSAGPVEQLDAARHIESLSYHEGSSYRRLFLQRGRLVGAIAVGAWDQASRVQQAVADQIQIWPWHIRRFTKEGELFSVRDGGTAALPATALVCTCTATSCGQLRSAVAQGAGDVPSLQA